MLKFARLPRLFSGARLTAILAMLAFAGLFARPAEAGPLVANGSFLQTTATTPGGYLCDPNSPGACVSQLTGWTATCAPDGCSAHASPSSILFAGTNGSAFNGGIGVYWNDAMGHPIGDVPGGGNVVAFDGDPQYASLLMQTINNLVVGDSYKLSFYQAATEQKGSNAATTEQFSVSLGGGAAQLSTLMKAPAQTAVDWQSQTMTFVATATSEVLQFAALGTPGGEPPVVLLGDVSLNVPEPAGIALFAGGMLALAFARRRARSV